MTAWRTKHPTPLTVTLHGRAELTNAIALAKYRGVLSEKAFQEALAALDDDFETGRYLQANLLWRATFVRAATLSREYTPSIGCRSLDVLHVASALELEIDKFMTFDIRQQQLARAAGLRVIAP